MGENIRWKATYSIKQWICRWLMNTSITLQIRLQCFFSEQPLAGWNDRKSPAGGSKDRDVAPLWPAAATRCLSAQQALCKSVFVVCLIVSKWECGYLFYKTQTAFCVWDSRCNSFLLHLCCSPENVRNMQLRAPALLVSFWFHLKLQQWSPITHNRLYIHQITHLYLNNTLIVLHFPSYCL